MDQNLIDAIALVLTIQREGYHSSFRRYPELQDQVEEAYSVIERHALGLLNAKKFASGDFT